MISILNIAPPVRLLYPVEYALMGVVLLTATASVAFHVRPEIDIETSKLFYYGKSFALAHYAGLRTLRALNDWIAVLVVALSVVIVSCPSLRSRWGVATKDALVPLITYGAGAGIIVNAIFKETFGRARPRNITEFGGDQIFSRAWEMSTACSSNCSFTSGEAATAAAIFSAFFIMPKMGRALGILIGLAIAILVAAFSLNRVAFGAHFISDVLVSILIVLAVMLAAKAVLDRCGHQGRSLPVNKVECAALKHVMGV